MFTTRRNFLKSSSLVALGLTVPKFVSRTAWAAPTAEKAGAKDSILVVIQLTGGNDGLNTVVPFKDPEYAKLRTTLRLPDDKIKKLNDEVALHPSMEGLAGLLQDRALTVVQGVGYPNPNQSHFRSMDIWQAASTQEHLTEGWLGKALKQTPAVGTYHLAENNEIAPLALAGSPVRAPSITSLEDFQLKMTASSGADKRAQKEIIEGVAKAQSGQPSLLDFVQRTATNTYASSERLMNIGKNYQPKSTYPNTPLASRLKLAAQLIDADIGARIFYVSLENFDTHANQLNNHANLLSQLSEAMTAFYKDMAGRGHKDRVLTMTFSEFGRRAHENGSKGTDHGSAAPMILVGGKVKAGVIGKHPSLTDLDQDNLKHHTDFRQVYATVLDQWLGVSSKEVLGQEFKLIELF
ncbi:MAG TPA: DUF1501 domain-containing protein [Gemmataceae bacterium]|jgi:uncharacterized protein (DUF1501 family)|nr:DUF1501 domain-containing protein [Gemmataceae bacterium]